MFQIVCRRRRPRQSTRLRVACVTVLLAVWGTQTAAAQRLQGRLLDLQSNQPISSGILTLITQDGERVATAVTDDEGSWLLDAPNPGVYFVEAKRLGYQPWIDGPLEIQPGDAPVFVYHLRAAAIPLDPVEISAAATERYLQLSGFYERQRSDFGHFMTPEDIQRRQAARITDMLVGLPGVRLLDVGGGAGGRHIQLRGGSLRRDGICRPRVFVDGLLFMRGDSRPLGVDDFGRPEQREALEQDSDFARLFRGSSLDDIGHPSTIAAVEIYRSAVQVPVQFGGTSIQTQCGVIVIWTKVGRMGTGGG